MNIFFRKATLNDLEYLIQLESNSFSSYQQSKKSQLEYSIKSIHRQVFIVEDVTKNTIGSFILYTFKNTLRIYSIAIDKEVRGNGMGSEMLRFIQEFAIENNFSKLSLEVHTSKTNLIDWYKKHDFNIVKTVSDYYSQNEHAFKMIKKITPEKKQKRYQNIIIIDKPYNWDYATENAIALTVNEYINNSIYQNNANFRVFNLCSSYKYQSYGYFVSLLAAARGQRVMPNIATVSDIERSNLVQSMTFDLDDYLNKTLLKSTENSFSLDIYFGQSTIKKYRGLAAKLYQIFEAPLFRVHLIYKDKWLIKSVKILTFKSLNEIEKQTVYQLSQNFFNKKRHNFPYLTSYKYDLAILVNPNEENPPSNKEALEKFRIAANKKGIYVELITKKDKDKINEFDALFIRETTNVNHHTYEYSRLAFAEGLVVLDDPWSILRCSNKIYQNELCIRNKILTPATEVITKNNFDKNLLTQLNYPVILKQPDSAFSLGVSKVNNIAEAEAKIKALFNISDMIICQEFLYSDYDWRIGVLDNKPLFACKYFMSKGHWQIYDWSSNEEDKSGNHQTVAIEDVPKIVIKTALKAAALIGDGLYGIDLKYIDGKVYLIEVNDNPNIDFGVEDDILKDKLYDAIVNSFITRIELSKNIRKLNLGSN